jgi:hypothetical protein
MKIGQIYNLDAFQEFLDSADAQGFKDSAAGVVLARNLTAVDPKIFEKKYPELMFVNSGISVDNSGGYVSRIQSLRLVDEGEFAVNGDKDGNKGKISLEGEDNFIAVKNLEAQSEWTETDIKTAQLQNVNLPSRFVQTHNKVYLRTIDKIGLVGHDGGTGLLNNTDFTSGAAAGAIDTLTALEMYTEISDLITDQNDAVNNTPEYMVNSVVMPTRVFNRLKKTMLNTANGSSTVLKALQDNFPEVTFQSTHRADTTANGGDLATSATVAYNNSSEAMVMRIPVPLQVGKIVQISSFRHHVESLARVAGLDILETTAGRILTGL